MIITSQGHVLAVYSSLTDVSSKTGLDHGSISNVCNGRQHHTKGFFLRFADADKELNPLSIAELNEAIQAAIERGEHTPTVIKNTLPVKIQVITSKGFVLATYATIIDAATKLNTSDSHIGDACIGKKKSARGFLFRRAVDKDAPVNALNWDELLVARQGAIERGEEDQSAASNIGKKRKFAEPQVPR